MRRDFAIIALLFFLPLTLFWQQTVGGKTLLPTENLYQYEPYYTYREVVKAPETPHNHLLSDLVLQNMQWKAFINDQFAQGEIPLWNPHQFSGTPFMAAGQQSTLYPLSLIYYIIPLPAAFGWFTVLNLWLAGVFMYLFGRGISLSRFGSTLAAITYQLAGMFIASAVHPMIIGAVVWLPLMLWMAEIIVRKPSMPAVAVGALALGCNILAGHPEITIYSLVILAYYAGIRLMVDVWAKRRETGITRYAAQRFGWLSAMVVLGLGLGAVQLTPLYDFVRTNWRAERSDLATVLSYAHKPRDIVQFLIPNFYGSPAHHTYLNVFNFETVSIGFTNALGEFRTHTDWGFKNYVEGALYLGILPLALSIFALFTRRNRYTLSFAALTVLSLTFAFGLMTYAVVYVLPGINQLNTPFRWIYAVTLSIAILAGFGADALAEHRKTARRFGFVLVGIGLLTLAALLLSRLFYGQLEPVFARVVETMAKANEAFDSPVMFYSYQFINVLIFGLMTLGSGIVFLWVNGDSFKITPARLFAVVLVALDLMIASWGFNPASDPALLDFVPPAVQWLQHQEGDWRYITLNGNGRDILPANVLLRYGLDDVTGYDSIISAQYVNYMRETTPQNLLDYNRIAPLYVWDDYNTIITSPQFNRLNVRYIISHKNTDITAPQVQLVHEDEAVRIWENSAALPRIYTVSAEALEAVTVDDLQPLTATEDTGRERYIDVEVAEPAWLVISESYAPGWKAYLRPQGGEESTEKQLEVQQVQGNFYGISLPDSGAWTVRFVYSPTSFQVGVFGTVISGALIVFMSATWFWQLYVGRHTNENSSAVSRLARNSITPIMLNLFNRIIDFVFASVMLRVLGPEDAGWYYYAIAVFMWFEILSNFGLDVFLMREAGRNRDRAGFYFYNTSALRLSLVFACIPLVIAFVLIRQASATPPLEGQVLITIALFYVGLVPGSLSKGLSSLFYVFEQAEYPAAVTTITTISRVVFSLMALLLGYGIVGLAAVSIVTNLITVSILFYNGRKLLGQIQPQRPDRHLMRSMMGESWSLMLNHFLATIFFQIDIVILEWVRDARSVGLYRVAYSWLLAINVIPAMFTQALLPVMSRQAKEDKQVMRRTYILAIKLLVNIAFPMAVAFTFLAVPLTWLLGGSSYLPDGAIALQIMIWSIPIGWMNSLTQYVLIALDLQRRITTAFIIAVAFNIVTNIILIPRFGYAAAALTTIASEMVLWVPFIALLQSSIGRLPWIDMLWRPVTASTVMFIVLLVGWDIQPVLTLLFGSLLYIGILLALRPFSADELNTLSPLFPQRLRRLLQPA